MGRSWAPLPEGPRSKLAAGRKVPAHGTPASWLGAVRPRAKTPVYLTRTLSRERSRTQTAEDCTDQTGVALGDLSGELIAQLLNPKKEDFGIQINPALN